MMTVLYFLWFWKRIEIFVLVLAVLCVLSMAGKVTLAVIKDQKIDGLKKWAAATGLSIAYIITVISTGFIG